MIQKLIGLLKKYKVVLIILGVILLIWIIYPKINRHFREKYENRINILMNDSIRSHILRDSIHIEYKVLQNKINHYNYLDSLRKQEYDKMRNHNSLLSRDSLRNLFTGS